MRCNDILSLVLDGLTPLQFRFSQGFEVFEEGPDHQLAIWALGQWVTSAVLGLLGCCSLLQSFEANHGYWKQPRWVWIVRLSLPPQSGVNACRRRIQVGGDVRLGECELGPRVQLATWAASTLAK